MEHSENSIELLENGLEGHIRASKRFFEADAILSVVAQYTNTYFVSVCPYSDSQVLITVKPKDTSLLSKDILCEMMNEFLDQQVRLNLQKEFGALRNTIAQYAFMPLEDPRV